MKKIREAVASVYTYKGSVNTYSLLPDTGQKVGDVYNVLDTGNNYAWNGTAWDDLAGYCLANPAGEATTDLTKLKVGSVIYALADKSYVDKLKTSITFDANNRLKQIQSSTQLKILAGDGSDTSQINLNGDSITIGYGNNSDIYIDNTGTINLGGKENLENNGTDLMIDGFSINMDDNTIYSAVFEDAKFNNDTDFDGNSLNNVNELNVESIYCTSSLEVEGDIDLHSNKITDVNSIEFGNGSKIKYDQYSTILELDRDTFKIFYPGDNVSFSLCWESYNDDYFPAISYMYNNTNYKYGLRPDGIYLNGVKITN